MKNKKKLLAIIIARGGSKGIPRKNLSVINGFPLIYWTINAAKNSIYIDKVILSSDDEEIISTASIFGVTESIRRSDELSGDDVSSVDVVLDAIDLYGDYEYVLMLQPTSPLRTSQDIDSAYLAVSNSGADSIVSVCRSKETPYWTYRLDEFGGLVSLLEVPKDGYRRQNLPQTYYLNGAIYIARTEYLLREKSYISNGTLSYVMEESKSLDIDTMEDLETFSGILNSSAPLE